MAHSHSLSVALTDHTIAHLAFYIINQSYGTDPRYRELPTPGTNPRYTELPPRAGF
jgi:hypothetical protein